MTREIELAKKCGIRYFSTPKGTTEMWCYDRDLQAFAEALIAAEREECAKACESNGRDLAGLFYAQLIRERSGRRDTCDPCGFRSNG